VQARFVARRRVLLDNAQLSRAVDHRESLRQRLQGTVAVFGFNQPPHAADLVPQPRGIAPIKLDAPFRLSDPLYCGKVIRHNKIFNLLGYHKHLCVILESVLKALW